MVCYKGTIVKLGLQVSACNLHTAGAGGKAPIYG